MAKRTEVQWPEKKKYLLWAHCLVGATSQCFAALSAFVVYVKTRLNVYA